MNNTIAYSTLDKVFNLHIDGSYYETYNLASGGGCVLDGEKVLDSFVDFLPSHIPLNFHEYFGLSHSLEKCLSLGISHLNVQTDCLRLLEDINNLNINGHVSDNTKKVINDLNILPMIAKFKSFKLTHVLRNQNKLADYLVGNFLETYIAEKKLVKLFNSKDNIYHNESKFFHSPDKVINKNTLKNIKDQVVIFLMFNSVNEIKIKFLHYETADCTTLLKEHNIIHNSKKWGNKVAKEFGHFIETLNIKEFRVSTLGTFQHKIFDYIRPHSEVLDGKISKNLDLTYETFDLISFSSFTDFTVKIKQLYETEYKEYSSSKLIDMNEQEKLKHPKVSFNVKQFLLVAMKALGEQEDLAQQFIKDNEDNEYIKGISHLPVDIIQKKIFDRFVDNIQEENFSLYLIKKEHLKEVGVKLKF